MQQKRFKLDKMVNKLREACDDQHLPSIARPRHGDLLMLAALSLTRELANDLRPAAVDIVAVEEKPADQTPTK